MGEFTLTFEQGANFILARLSKGQTLEIRIPRKEQPGRVFVKSTSSGFGFCERLTNGIAAVFYYKGNSMDGHLCALFNRLIRREAGGRKQYESRFLVMELTAAENLRSRCKPDSYVRSI